MSQSKIGQAFQDAAEKFLTDTKQTSGTAVEDLRAFTAQLAKEADALLVSGTPDDVGFLEDRLAAHIAGIANNTIQDNKAALLAIATGVLRVVIALAL